MTTLIANLLSFPTSHEGKFYVRKTQEVYLTHLRCMLNLINLKYVHNYKMMILELKEN